MGLRAHSFFTPEMRRIVGVVGEVRHGGLTSEPAPVFYERFHQDPKNGFTLLVRSPRPAGDLAAEVRGVMAGLDPELPMLGVPTLAERRREIGIRMALGAEAGRVRRLVFAQALGVTAVGVTAGLVGAVLATRTLEGLLFRVSPADPLVLVLLPVILMAAAVVAAWVPTRRATAVDPVRMLQDT